MMLHYWSICSYGITLNYSLKTSIGQPKRSETTISYVLFDNRTRLRHTHPWYHNPQSWLRRRKATAYTIHPIWHETNIASELTAWLWQLMERKSGILSGTMKANYYNWNENEKSPNLSLKRSWRRKTTEEGQHKANVSTKGPWWRWTRPPLELLTKMSII